MAVDFERLLEEELERQRRQAQATTQSASEIESAIQQELANVARARESQARWIQQMSQVATPEQMAAHPLLVGAAEFLTRPIRAFMQTPVGQFIERSSQVAAPTFLFQPPEAPTATTGSPYADVAADVLGQLAGTLGQWTVAQGVSGAALQGLARIPQLARMAELAPTALQAAGRGAATGGALSGLQAAFAPPGEGPSLQEALQNIAFTGGAGLGGALTQAALRSRFPGLPALPEAVLTGAAAGATGAAAAAPFGDYESLPDFLKDVAVDATALAIMHGTFAALRPPTPEQEFVRHMRRTAEELERAQRAAAAGDEAAVRAAYRRYWENINSAYHFGVQSGHREVGTRLPAEAAIRFELAFQRATQRPIRDVTPGRPAIPGVSPGISPGMAQQVMEYARSQAPRTVTPEEIRARFPSMSRQQAQRAYEQIIQAHEITPLPPPEEPLPPEAVEPTPTVPETPPHRLDPVIDFLSRLQAQGIDLSVIGAGRPTAPPTPPVEEPPAIDVTPAAAPPVEAPPSPTSTAEAPPVQPPTAPVEPATDIQVGQTVYDLRGNPLEVVDASDAALLTVRNQRGTTFRIGRRVVRREPPEGIRPVETASPEAPERAAEAPQVISPMPTPAPFSTPPVEPQAQSATVEAPGVSPTQAAPPQPAPQPPIATGARTTAATERGTEVETEWAVVDARNLITSHDTMLRPNPAFPQELQPRDRTRAASELQITRMVNTLRPEFLAESPKASEGAPIVGPDMIVESGNARSIALKRAYEQSAPTAEQYRQYLIQNADRFGLDPEVIRQTEAPVLVRVRRTGVDRRQFVIEANEGAVAAMSATEQAMADAERMSEGLMSLFQVGDDGEILTRANREFVSRFAQEIVSPADRGRILDERGQLSQEGLNRIRNAVFAKAYGDPSALSILAESTDSNVRNITGGMLMAAPRIAQMREAIRRGEVFNLDPAADITAAMRKLSDLRYEGTPVDVYLSQTQMFADDLSDLAKDFLALFEANKRSRKRIANILQTYVDIVEALGDPRQESLFEGRPVPRPENVLQAAIEKVNEGYEPRAGQATLFESEPVRSALAEESPGPVAQDGGRPAEEPPTPTAETLGFPATTPAEPGAPKRVAHDRPTPRPEYPERVVTRKEVMDYIERQFMMPIRVGRMRLRGARGEFNLKTHVTRLRSAEDFRAITHEFGHFLSETIPLNPEQYPELQPLGAALYPDAPPDLQREEGNAEFFYLYLSNPEAAKAAAPSYYADFEELLRKDPALGAKVRELQRMSVQLFNQTGTAAVKAMIVREDPKAVPFLTPVQRFYTAWVDDLHPIWVLMKYVLGEENAKSEWDVQLSQNPVIFGRLARGRFRKAHALLTRGQISPNFQQVGPSFQEILRPVAHVIEDFEAYLVAKRALELWDRGINPGIDQENARRAVQELERQEFVEAQQQLVRYQDLLIDHMVDAGVLDKRTADSFRDLNRDYVPFYRYMGEESVTRGFSGSRLKWGDLPRLVRRIEGSSRSIYSPLHSIVRNTYAMIDVAERNRAARAFYDLIKDKEGIGWLVEEVPTPMQPNKVELERLRKDLIDAGIPKQILDDADLERVAVIFSPVRHARWKEKQENILTVYVDGQPRFLKLHPELYRAFQFMDQPAYNLFFQLLAFPTRLLRAGATLNLDFSPRNLFRDQFSAFMNRKYRFWPFIDPARAMMSAIRGNIGKGDELYDKWLAAGGAQSTMVSLNRDYLEKDLRRMIGQYTTRDKVAQIIRSPLTALEFISSVLEESTRLAQFRAGIRAEGETPEGIRRAAAASREISVDFQRAGTHSRQVNQVKAFFNAAIQGTDQMARNWRRDPAGYTLRAFLFITMPTVALYLMNRDDPRYWELPQWRRDLYWVWFSDDEVYFFPKPFELGVMFGTLPERILQWVMENDPEAFDEFAGRFIEATMPVDLFNPVDWLPDAFTPILEVYANRRIFGDSPVVPRSEQDLLPQYQYGAHTSEFAKALGRWTGSSPRKIEHLITGYGAGLARHTLRFLDRLAGVERPTPIIRPFTSDPFISATSIDDFYEELDHLERLNRTANELRRRGLQAEVQANQARLRYLRRVRDDLSGLRRMARYVMEHDQLSAEEKRRMLGDLNLRMTNLARVALGKPPIAPQQ